jgi:hypothetical protein
MGFEEAPKNETPPPEEPEVAIREEDKHAEPEEIQFSSLAPTKQ